MLMFAFNANAHEKCRVKLEPVGIYTKYCPKGTLVEANSTQVNIVGPSIFVYDTVRCVRPRIICRNVKEKVDSTQEMEDNNYYD